MSRFPPFVIYLSPQLKRVFMHAADYAHKSLSEHVRDLLAADVEKRAIKGEPHFAELRDELREALEANRQREIEIRTRPRPCRRKEASAGAHSLTNYERQELANYGLGSESSRESIALKEIKSEQDSVEQSLVEESNS